MKFKHFDDMMNYLTWDTTVKTNYNYAMCDHQFHRYVYLTVELLTLVKNEFKGELL